VTALALPPPSFIQLLFGFISLAEKTAASKLAYRFASFISILTNTLGYCIFLLVWREVYRQGTAVSVPRAEIFPYLLLAFLVNGILTLGVEARFNQRLRTGAITSDLLQPLGFVNFQMAQGVGDAMANSAFVLPVYVVGWCFLGPAVLPASFASAAIGGLSLVLAFLINFGLSFFVIQACCVLHSAYGVISMRLALHQVFSGLSAPIVLFPEPLHSLAKWLPFRHIVETPASIWLGQVAGARLPQLLATQVAWALVLLITSQLLARSLVRFRQVQGG